jgi:hypothetical protein
VVRHVCGPYSVFIEWGEHSWIFEQSTSTEFDSQGMGKQTVELIIGN